MKKLVLNSGEEIEVSDDIADIANPNSLDDEFTQVDPSRIQAFNKENIIKNITENIFCYITYNDSEIIPGIVERIHLKDDGSLYKIYFSLFKKNAFKFIRDVSIHKMNFNKIEVHFEKEVLELKKNQNLKPRVSIEKSSPEFKCLIWYV